MDNEGLTINPGPANPVSVQPGATRSAQPEQKRSEPQEVVSSPVRKKLDPELLAKITEEINEDFRIFNTSISFSVDKDSGSTVIKIFDRETEKVIREIPPLEMLRLAAKLTELIGLIVDETA